MATITASIGKAHYRMDITTATNAIVADEPLELGGGDLGFTPDELLAASLGACTSATLRMYADRKGWDNLTGVEVTVTFNRGNDRSFFNRNIVLEGELTEEQRTRLLEIANKCPVHRTLSNASEINTVLS